MLRFDTRQSGKPCLISCSDSGLTLVGRCCQAAQVDTTINLRLLVLQGMKTSNIIKIPRTPNYANKISARKNADAQTRWVKRDNKHYYYWVCMASYDTKGGFIDTTATKPTNGSRTKQFKRLIQQFPSSAEGALG